MTTRPSAAPGLIRGPLRALTVGSVALVSLGAFEAIAIGRAGTIAYIAGTTVAGGLALVAVLVAGRARAAAE
jgi:hypothetical protein